MRKKHDNFRIFTSRLRFSDHPRRTLSVKLNRAGKIREKVDFIFGISLFQSFPESRAFSDCQNQMFTSGRTYACAFPGVRRRWMYEGGGRSGRVWMEHGEWEILFVKCHNMYFSDRVTFFRLKSYIRMVGRSPGKCFKDADNEWLIAGLTLKSFLQANNRISRNRDTP